jgi:hypothetical protein
MISPLLATTSINLFSTRSLKMALGKTCTLIVLALAVGGAASARTVVGVRQSAEGLAALEELFWAVATKGHPQFGNFIHDTKMLKR